MSMEAETAPKKIESFVRRIRYTIGLPIKSHRFVLLAQRRKGMGIGLWTGYGGRIKPRETPYNCIVRECWEEARITVNNAQRVGDLVVEIWISGNLAMIMDISLFIIDDWEGDPQDSEEMENGRLFSLDEIPLESMFPADKIWVHSVLNGSRLIKIWASYNVEDLSLVKPVFVKATRMGPAFITKSTATA
jgi:8-oxo-dGTP pyrophosphatase MutT (NUDIX family)